MAVIKPVITQIGRMDESLYLATWTAIGENDTVVEVNMPNLNDKSVQVNGTFGGGTVTISGSNDGGANFYPLRSPDSVALAFTASGLKAVLENPQLIKPVLTAGTGMAVNVAMVLHQTNPLRQ